MRPRSHLVPVAVAAVMALSACQDPDVGQDCTIDLTAPGGGPLDLPTPPPSGPLCSSDKADYFRTGAIECDNLVCVRSSTGGCAADAVLASIRHYCSKACVSDRDCFTGQTGLVCRQIVLDPVFLATLPPDVRARYLGQIQASNYCATPVAQ
jgi:hypothetical protein